MGSRQLYGAPGIANSLIEPMHIHVRLRHVAEEARQWLPLIQRCPSTSSHQCTVQPAGRLGARRSEAHPLADAPSLTSIIKSFAIWADNRSASGLPDPPQVRLRESIRFAKTLVRAGELAEIRIRRNALDVSQLRSPGRGPSPDPCRCAPRGKARYSIDIAATRCRAFVDLEDPDFRVEDSEAGWQAAAAGQTDAAQLSLRDCAPYSPMERLNSAAATARPAATAGARELRAGYQGAHHPSVPGPARFEHGANVGSQLVLPDSAAPVLCAAPWPGRSPGLAAARQVSGSAPSIQIKQMSTSTDSARPSAGSVRRAASRKPVQHGCERVHVGRRGVRRAAHLLGTGVFRCQQQLTGQAVVRLLVGIRARFQSRAAWVDRRPPPGCSKVSDRDE